MRLLLEADEVPQEEGSLMEDTGQPFTFSHFVEEEALAARVVELGNRYEPEHVAAAAFYLGMLSLAGITQLTRLFGDQHYIFHLMSNIYIGEWLTDLVEAGVINPEKTFDFVVREYGDRLGIRPDGAESIDAEDRMERLLNDGMKPMDKDTFSRLWGE